VVPFANVIPGLAIGMVGACLMARRPLFGWSATLLSAAFTAGLLALGGTVLAALRRLLPGT
jgi:hypothetical protein